MSEQIDLIKFEPIKGYPMLSWKGKRPYTSTQYYPAQLKETHGVQTDGWINKIFWGDNLQVMSHLLKDYRGKINLIYIDPPFDSKADYKRKIALKGKNVENAYNTFEEKQYTDIWTNDEYLQFMYERLILMRELLADDGSIYIHVDYRKNSYIRIIMDEIFGMNNFKAEISWQKLRSVKSQSKHFANMKDNILVYSKNSNPLFIPQLLPKDQKLLKTHYRHEDPETGKRYNLADFTQAGLGPAKKFGDKTLDPPQGKHWIWSQERIDEGMKIGLIVFSKSGMPYVKRYFDDTEGMRIGDLWSDINPINQVAKERLDYPTQKPEALIERIINASSNPGDIVFDCFCGSGTTQAVAMKLGRRFIGADINLGAIHITTKRLLNVQKELEAKQNELFDTKASKKDKQENLITKYYTGFEAHNVNHYDFFKNPVQAKELLLEALEINPYNDSTLYDGEKDGFQVKIMPVNRIATKADLNQIITNVNYKKYEKIKNENPNQVVENIMVICMGHDPELAAELKRAIPYKLKVEVVDILRDKSALEFKKDSEAEIIREEDHLVIAQFYPMNLLQKLSLLKENVEIWQELVETVMIDWNYDGGVFEPKMVDIPEKNKTVKGKYKIPEDHGTIKVKITDLLSEVYETEL